MKTLLEINSLIGGFPGRKLFRDINLILNSGDKVAIMGPNGSGKTSLLRTIIGYYQLQSGWIMFNGQKNSSRRDLGKLISYIPQNAEVYPGLLSFELFEELPVPNEITESLSVQHLLKQPFRSLSGGERQRILLASALARQPRVILADELTQGVDQDFSIRFADCIDDFPEKHEAALLIVTHDREWAEQNCNRRYFLTEGGLVSE